MSGGTQPARRVVVTGMGVVSPLGCDVDQFWRRLVAGESGVGEITRFDHSDHRVHIAAEVQGFDPEDYVDKRTVRRLDLFSRYAVGAAALARDDAGIDPRAEAERTGAVIGSGVGGLQTLHVEIEKLLNQGPERTNPLLIPMMIPNMGAAQVSLELGTKGPLSSTCTACAAGSDAIASAFHIIRRGDAEVMFAGGSEAPISAIGVAGFAAARSLSRRNDDPTAASRPFDAGRDGFVIGEGAGCLVLEDLEHALRRDARIHAELAGVGLSSDSFHMTAPDETGESQARAMKAAIDLAGLAPSDIAYVNAHGTATLAGDIAETKAIKVALGEHAADCRRLVEQVDDRALPRRLRRHRGGGDRPHDRQQPGAADHQPHRSRPRVRPRLRPARVPLHEGRRGRLEQLRLRRPQRHPGLPPVRRLTPSRRPRHERHRRDRAQGLPARQAGVDLPVVQGRREARRCARQPVRLPVLRLPRAGDGERAHPPARRPRELPRALGDASARSTL